jgi:hypothetical protein
MLRRFGQCDTNTCRYGRILSDLLWDVLMFQAWWVTQGHSQSALAAA